jgi:hypothetical protein
MNKEESRDMAENEITQIRVGNYSVSIIGLKGLLEEMTQDFGDKDDDAVQSHMFERLNQKNYIPGSAKEDYQKAFLREFRKFMGQPFVETATEGVDIKVLGPGCSQCDSMEKLIMETLAEIQLPASVDHVRDMKEIARYGIMGVPALLINGKVVCTGSVPPRNKLKSWLLDAKARLSGETYKK